MRVFVMCYILYNAETLSLLCFKGIYLELTTTSFFALELHVLPSQARLMR